MAPTADSLLSGRSPLMVQMARPEPQLAAHSSAAERSSLAAAAAAQRSRWEARSSPVPVRSRAPSRPLPELHTPEAAHTAARTAVAEHRSSVLLRGRRELQDTSQMALQELHKSSALGYRSPPVAGKMAAHRRAARRMAACRMAAVEVCTRPEPGAAHTAAEVCTNSAPDHRIPEEPHRLPAVLHSLPGAVRRMPAAGHRMPVAGHTDKTEQEQGLHKSSELQPPVAAAVRR
mmetsp:Transcript_7010/g.15102  ORF Transcript_7010/g.15102 Transcript_7010/m.15102 type:complete len:232 (-) Transcript_7010:448-1143(-)